MRVNIAPGQNFTVTDANGDYRIFLANGNYTLSTTAPAVYTPSCGSTATANITGLGQSYCDRNFAFTSSCPSPDLKVDVTATSLRVGRNNLLAVTIYNNGSLPATNINIKVDFGNKLQVKNASTVWTVVKGSEYEWTLNELGLGKSTTVYVTAFVPVAIAIGEMVNIAARVACTENECSQTNNTFALAERTTGAIDPNDLQVSPEGGIRAFDELSYKIRFQNVGSDVARTVTVEDVLPESLDLSTLQLGAASHAYRFSVEGRKLIWQFENINLPDSVNNEPESHGYILFKIRPLGGLPVNTIIENTASIVFDEQGAVRTNTTSNFIKSLLPEVKKNGEIVLFPNPAVYSCSIVMPKDVTVNAITIFDAQGKLTYTQDNPQDTVLELDIEGWNAGIYFIRVSDDEGKIYNGRMIKL
jgi:hypothetical protein